MNKIFFIIAFIVFTVTTLLKAEEDKQATSTQQTKNDQQVIDKDIDKYLELTADKYYKIDTKYPLSAAYTTDDEYIYISIRYELVGSAISIGFTRAEQNIATYSDIRSIDYITITFNKTKNAYVVNDTFIRAIGNQEYTQENQDVSLLKYEIDKGYTYIQIKRKLKPEDKFDFPIEKDKPIKIVFVVNENYDTKSSIKNIDFTDVIIK